MTLLGGGYPLKMALGSRLKASSACVLSSSQLSRRIGAGAADWARLGRHWEDLAVDGYAAELGTMRLRRYGHYAYTPADGSSRLLPHDVFAQPEKSNPLYVDRDRVFEPLTDEFATDPLLLSLLALLGEVASVLDDVVEWSVKVTPFRVLASADCGGDPTPEGPHRDGVTLVASVLIGRHNAIGGMSTVYDREKVPIMSTTLREPGSMLVGDDRCVLHGVSPIRPIDPASPARRDVLVITFAPSR